MDEQQPAKPRRRFRFGLKTLLGVVVLVALPASWVGYSLRWIDARKEFRVVHDSARLRGIPHTPRSAPGLLWLFGERPVLNWQTSELTREEVAEAKRLFPEAFPETDAPRPPEP